MNVSIRPGLRLPTSSACSDCDTEGDVVEARQATTDNDVSGWRIVVAGEVAAEHGDLEQIGGECPAQDAWLGPSRVNKINRRDFGWSEQVPRISVTNRITNDSTAANLSARDVGNRKLHRGRIRMNRWGGCTPPTRLG